MSRLGLVALVGVFIASVAQAETGPGNSAALVDDRGSEILSGFDDSPVVGVETYEMQVGGVLSSPYDRPPSLQSSTSSHGRTPTERLREYLTSREFERESAGATSGAATSLYGISYVSREEDVRKLLKPLGLVEKTEKELAESILKRITTSVGRRILLFVSAVAGTVWAVDSVDEKAYFEEYDDPILTREWRFGLGAVVGLVFVFGWMALKKRQIVK